VFIELIDVLRCTRAHEESWLVGAFDEVRDRDVVRGRLGCPVCRAEYGIVDGTVLFDAPVPAPAATAGVSAAAVDPDETLRLAALLGLVGGGGVVLLAGAWGAHAAMLEQLVPARYVVLNPGVPVSLGPSGSVLVTEGAVPLGAGSVRGAAHDDATAGLLPGALAALAPRGRLVAPATVAVPADVAELARDARHWVAERDAAASAPVPLRARSRGPER